MAQSNEIVTLAEPSHTGSSPLEHLLAKRRSVRDFQNTTVELAQIGQLLWAAQGITHARGLRTAPSAGALYPLELYVVAGRVNGLAKGIYHYDPETHQLMKIRDGDHQDALSKAASSQDWVKAASAVIVFAADFERTTKKYGKRGIRYVHIEVGHAAENLFLQAEALELATVIVGAFKDNSVAKVLQLPDDLQPLLLMPVGRK
jgi:SagB-type dehydrogenase family enzyme